MAGTTTNGLPYPESTDFVTDGAQAIEDLAVDVDERIGLYMIRTCTVTSTGGTAASASNGVITIGNGNTLVTISDAFSANYDNYRIVFSGIDFSTSGNLHFFTLGSLNTNYFGTTYYDNYTGSPAAYARYNGAAYLGVLIGGTESDTFCTMEVCAPFLTRRPSITGMYHGTGYSGWFSGTNLATTSVTSFTLTTQSGTMTGGEIRVYGYRN